MLHTQTQSKQVGDKLGVSRRTSKKGGEEIESEIFFFFKKQQEGKERDVLIRHITVKCRVFNIITLSCNFMLVLQADLREIKG